MKSVLNSVCFVAAFGITCVLSNDSCAEWKPPKFSMPERGICAHRGASDTHPENTLAAFRQAIQLGAQMIEFDVAQTRDGALVLMHDATVNRTTNGTGRVADLSLQQIRKLDAGSWKHPRFREERVPTLEEALRIMPENIWLNVHLKGETELALKTAKTILEHRRTHQCFLACSREAAAAVHKNVSDRILWCNMDRQGNSDQYVSETIKADADFIQLLGQPKADPQYIEQLRHAGIRVNFCCSNDAKATDQLLRSGVQFVLADKVAEMLRVSDQHDIDRLTPVYHPRLPEDSVRVRHRFKDGEVQVMEEFSDEKLWIHHDLWVETEFDSDGDGKLDRMHVSVTRPRQTDTQGLRVPVIYNSSPYYSGTASGTRDFFWNPRQELGQPPPPHADPPSIPWQCRRLVISRSHWKDWLPRGYAVVHSASPGTGLSQGCPTIGGDNESLAPKAVIEWLAGKANGYSSLHGNRPVTAYWSTGKTGMTGTSFNGTLALAAATTGVAGLEAIIPVAPNTSYYHYYRSHGLVRHPGGYLGEDIDVLYNFVNSGNPDRRSWCNTHIRDGEMAKGFDRIHGDYNPFWAGRDYLNDLGPLRTPMLMSHAFNDWNVVPEHSVRIYHAVQQKGVPVQCYFHQGGHGGPPPVEMMNRWFTRYLHGIKNRVEKAPKAYIVREGNDRLKPTAYPDYPHPESAMVSLFPHAGGQASGALQLAPLNNSVMETLTDDVAFRADQLAQAASSPHRLLYITPKLKTPVHISGTTVFRTKLSCSKPAANVSVLLVSLPWNGAAGARIHDNIITRGWADPQNRHSISETRPLKPGTFYPLKFTLQPDDQIIPAGQQIGLMVFSSDRDFTLHPTAGTKLTIDLAATQLDLPVVGGPSAFEQALTKPENTATGADQ